MSLNTENLPPWSNDGLPPRLRVLAHHGRQAHERAQGMGMSTWSDDLSHVSPERRAAWRRILSSVATTETLEGVFMTPLLEARRNHPEALDYLEVHVADEHRHKDLICAYLKNTFDYVKTKRTLMDQVLYDRVFTGVSKIFYRKPLYGYALLYGYEKFSITFYGQLKAAAQADGAQNLLTMLQMIEKDELRHVSGMEFLMREEIRKQGGLKLGDAQAVGALLGAMVLDVDMSPYAYHNREVREHLRHLDIDTAGVTEGARATRRATLDIMRQMADEWGAGHA